MLASLFWFESSPSHFITSHVLSSYLFVVVLMYTVQVWCLVSSLALFSLPTECEFKCVCQSLSRVWLFATPWTAVRRAPLSMRFSRQEYWSGLPCPPPGDLPDPGIEPRSPALQADSLPAEPPGKRVQVRGFISVISVELCRYSSHPATIPCCLRSCVLIWAFFFFLKASGCHHS